MKKYNLILNEEQVQSVMWALDFYGRMKCGQLGVLKELRETKQLSTDDEYEAEAELGKNIEATSTMLQRQLFPKLSGLNNSFGIAGVDSPEEAKVCYDIYKEIHFVFNPVGVYGYKPYAISKQGLPKFEEIKE